LFSPKPRGLLEEPPLLVIGLPVFPNRRKRPLLLSSSAPTPKILPPPECACAFIGDRPVRSKERFFLFFLFFRKERSHFPSPPGRIYVSWSCVLHVIYLTIFSSVKVERCVFLFENFFGWNPPLSAKDIGKALALFDWRLYFLFFSRWARNFLPLSTA